MNAGAALIQERVAERARTGKKLPHTKWTLEDWQSALATACEVGGSEIDELRALLLEIDRLATVASLSVGNSVELDEVKRLIRSALYK